MTVPTASEFTLRFPEFGEQPLAVVESALAEAGRFTQASVWGDRHTDAVNYLAAHLLSSRVTQIGSQIGVPATNAQGQLLMSTLYGQEYTRLRDTLPLTGFVV